MSVRKEVQSLENLEWALARLDEALTVPPDAPLAIDGTIQRFEFAIELTWKTLKRFLEVEGVATTTPRESLRAAHAAGWLSDEAVWLAMLSDRNATSHIYDEAKARQIYERVRGYAPVMRDVALVLRRRGGLA